MLPKGSFLYSLRRRSPMPGFLCGTPEMPWKKAFLPPDFGDAHPSDPRLHVQFYAYFFRDTTLAPDNQERRTLPMRCLSLLAVLGFLALGCAHGPPSVSTPSSTASFPLPVTLVAYDPGQTPPYFPALVAKSEDGSGEGRGDLSADAETGSQTLWSLSTGSCSTSTTSCTSGF
jgi:hypothetical protein